MTPDGYKGLTVRSQAYLEQVKAGVARDLARKLNATALELEKIIKQVGVATVNELSVTALNKLIAELRAAETVGASEVAADIMSDAGDVALNEVSTGARALARVVGGKVSAPATAQTLAAVLKRPLAADGAAGQLLQPFVDGMVPRQVKQTEALIRKSWVNGATVQEMVQGIRGTKARGFKDGITSLKTRQAEAVARTAIQHVANTARQELWLENDDIVSGYEWLSTLDAATSPICRNLDGQKFLFAEEGSKPLPPAHINCRSTTVPTFDDGLDFLDAGATRSAEFGTVSAETKFYDFLKQQDRPYIEGVLGKERAAIFLDEGLTPEQFRKLGMDKNFQPLTVAEMRAKLDADILSAPPPNTATGRVWTISDDLKTTLGRDPTRKEVIEAATAAGINPSTASTQYGKWKKETGGIVVPPVVKPTSLADFTSKAYTDKIAALPAAEREALANWSLGGYYDNVNDNLRGLPYAVGKDTAEEMVPLLDSALSKFELDKAVTVRRGFGKTDPLFTQALDSLEGSVITDKGYLATTLSDRKKLEDYFTGGGTAEIRLPAGTKAIYIESVTNAKGMQELLVQRNMKFRVVSAKLDVDGKRNVVLEGILPDTTPKPPIPVAKVTGNRVGMPGKGATRKVWELADELEVTLGREPTRVELLARTKALGINDSTAGTQFGKWRKAGAGGGTVAPTARKVAVATPAPRPIATPATRTQAQRDSEWLALKKDLEAASKPRNTTTAAAMTYDDVNRIASKEFPNLREDMAKYRLNGTWRTGTPARVISDYQNYALRYRELTKQVGFRAQSTVDLDNQMFAVLRQKRSGTFKSNIAKVKDANSRAKIGQAEQFVRDYVNPDLVEKLSKNRPMGYVVGKTNRAFYSSYKNSVNISLREDVSTIVHEIIHALEYVDKRLSDASKAFLKSRSNGQPTQKLSRLTGNKSYRDDEMAYEDKWVERKGSHYMGKLYSGNATELLTMGVERLRKSPYEFYTNDPEYFEFLVRQINDL